MYSIKGVYRNIISIFEEEIQNNGIGIDISSLFQKYEFMINNIFYSSLLIVISFVILYYKKRISTGLFSLFSGMNISHNFLYKDNIEYILEKTVIRFRRVYLYHIIIRSNYLYFQYI